MRSYGYCCVAYVFGSFFGNNFAFENLQPLANPKSGWFTSIIMIVAVAPWAYVGFDSIPQTAEEFNFSPNKTFKLIVYQRRVCRNDFIHRLAFGYIGFGGVLAIAIIMGIFTGLNGF